MSALCHGLMVNGLLWSHFGKHFFFFKLKKKIEEFFRSKFDILCDDICSGTFLLSKFVSPMHFPICFPFFFCHFPKYFGPIES